MTRGLGNGIAVHATTAKSGICIERSKAKPNWLRMQVIIRDVGVFNDTLMAELLEELGQLREMDIVLLNWGAWYPRFTWGYSEVNPTRASCLHLGLLQNDV